MRDMDVLDAKAGMLAKLGSFWYRSLEGAEKAKAHRLSHMAFYTRMLRLFANTMDLTLQAGVFQDNYRVVRFKDSDILYYGLEPYLQKRYNSREKTPPHGKSRGGHATIQEGFVTAETVDSPVLSDADGEPILMPDGAGQQAYADWIATFGLKVPEDMCVTAIELPDGTLLTAGTGFRSRFGLVMLPENPISLFPKMKFMAVSCLVRKRNLYSYPLQLRDCYGSADAVWEYYRRNQSPAAFRKALLQACGLPIIRQDCYVKEIMPLPAGCIYYTDDGNRYTAAFKHAKIPVGYGLKAGDIIGTDVIDVILPDQDLPNWVTGISMDTALPVKGLVATWKKTEPWDSVRWYEPQYDGDADALQYFLEHCVLHGPDPLAQEIYDQWSATHNTPDNPLFTSLIEHVRNHLLPGRHIIVAINNTKASEEMKLAAHEFADREHPTGAVLLYTV